MKTKITRIFTYLSISMVAILLLMVVAFFVFRPKIIELFQKEVNKYLNADVSVQRIYLTVFTDFPNVSIDLERPIIMEGIKGSKDTLVSAEKIYLTFDVLKLFKGDYLIDECHIEHGYARLKVLVDGTNNYTIFKSDSTASSKELSFSLKKIAVRDMDISYLHEQHNTQLIIHAKDLASDLGFRDKKWDIGLQGDIHMNTFLVDSNQYLTDKNITLNTRLYYTPDNKRIEIVPSDVLIETSNFDIRGAYQIADVSKIDLSFKADKSDIQAIVSMLPRKVHNAIKEYKSKGTVYMQGEIHGDIGDGMSPGIDIEFGFENASFYHPKAKKEITNARLKGKFTNGSLRSQETTVLSLKEVKGSIQGQSFAGELTYRNFLDPYVSLSLMGMFDVKSILEVAPNIHVENATGKIGFDIALDGKKSDIENKRGEVRTSGEITLLDVGFKEKNRTIAYSGLNGTFLFNKTDIGITDFYGKLGNTDFKMNGFLKNALSYLFMQDPVLTVEAAFESKLVDLDELLTQQTPNANAETKSSPYYLSISSKLSLDLDCKITTLKARGLSAENAGRNLIGELHLNNRVLKAQNLQFTVAGGTISMESVLNAQNPEKLIFNSIGRINKMNIDRVFLIFENFGQSFITNSNIKGALSTDFQLHLELNKYLEVNIDKLLADFTMSIDDGKLVNFAPMKSLETTLRQKNYTKYLKNDNLSLIQFSQIKNTIRIENKTIHIPKMEIISSASDIVIQGTHTFDNKIDYEVSFPLVNYKKAEKDAVYGIQQDPKSQKFRIFLRIKGTTESYEVIFDKKQSAAAAKEKIKQDIIQAVKQDEDKPTHYIGVDKDTTHMLDLDDF